MDRTKRPLPWGGKRPDKTASPLSFGGITRIRFKGSTVRSLSDSAPSDTSTLTKKKKECNQKFQKETLQVVRQFAINCLQITKNLFEILFILIYNDRRLGGLWKSYYRSQYLLERGAIKNEKNEDNGWQHRGRICFLCVYGSCSDLPDHSFFSYGRSK